MNRSGRTGARQFIGARPVGVSTLEESLAGRDRPQDAKDVRAKSSGHKKKTADAWNQ